MKIADYKNEDALELLGRILEPIGTIFSDKALASYLQKGNNLKAVKLALSKYKKELIEVLSALDGVSVKDYNANIFHMSTQLLDIVNDKELIDFFISQGKTTSEESIGLATENTEDGEI